MAYGMPPGFADLLRRKYDILQQQADAVTTNAGTNRIVGQAGANLDRARTRVLPEESAANVANIRSRTEGQNITNRFLPQSLLADIDFRKSGSALNRANVGLIGERTEGERQLNKFFNLDKLSRFSGYGGGSF